MKISEFVEMYKKNPRIDMEKYLDVKKYIGIEQKRQMAKLILDNCTYIDDGIVRLDSVERYLLFTMIVISTHTNLELTHEEDSGYSAIDDYDMLCESGLLVKVVDTFKDDYASCQEILNMMTADRMQGSMTIEQKIGGFLDEVQNTLSNAIDNLTDKINFDELAGKLPVDQNKLLELYNMVKEN